MERNEAINHVTYRHLNDVRTAFLMRFVTTRPLALVDLTRDGHARLYVNAHGNKRYARRLAKSAAHDGYVNPDEQAEVCLARNAGLRAESRECVPLTSRVSYRRVSRTGWRMRRDTQRRCAVQ